MNMGVQLKDIQRGFEAVNSFPELKNIPVIVGECDPEGCAACSEKRDPNMVTGMARCIPAIPLLLLLVFTN
jgi:xylan 1,4-beta-xylosidase